MYYVPILQVRPELQHVIGQLAFGVELQSLQPDPNPMNTKWLSDFITEKVVIRIGYLPCDRVVIDVKNIYTFFGKYNEWRACD